jgi:hypothetical protein
MEPILNKPIDETFMYEYNKDLTNMNQTQLKQHYISKGQMEGNMLSNLHIQQILRNRHFHIAFYKSHYDDTNNKNMTEIINHYITVGQKEGRIVSKKHASILTNNPEFDIEFYKSHYIDLHDMTPTQLVTHYIESGKAAGRLVCLNQIIDITKQFKLNQIRARICIIYVYYEIKNEQQNQNNLAFFIKYGLDKSRWRDMDVTTLFIINGQHCEVLLPKTQNVHVLYNTTNDYDAEKSYNMGIDYFTNKYNTTICNLFTHVCLLNVSNFGPIYSDINDSDINDSNINITSNHWLDPLINGSSIDDTSTISNKLSIIDCNKSHIFGKYDDDFLKLKLNYKEGIFDISNYKDFFNKTNNKCIIYAHYDKSNIIKQYVLETLAIFAQLGYDILFYTTSSIINNYDEEYLPFKINYFNLNYGAGTDWHMWLAGCKLLKSQSDKYDWITLINDSMLIGINGLENMKETIHEMEHQDLDFWGHWDSNEINYHVMSSFYVLKYSIINHYIMFCEQFLMLCKTKKDIIFKCETKFTLYLKSRGCKTGVVIEEETLPFSNHTQTPSHNPVNISSWINNKKAFGVKWKYMLAYLANKPINDEFKERLRLIPIGDCLGIYNIFNVK